MSSSPTNSSPKSPSPRVPIRPRKKAAPKAPNSMSSKNAITRSLSCGGFQANVLPRANITSSMKMSQLSISHEDLLNAAYADSVFQEKDMKGESKEINSIESSATVLENVRPKRAKPPRHHRNGLPPVAERAYKPIERPSVPPPERPDSYIKTSSISSEVSDYNDKAIDLDDISISLNSSGSETYNECQMSFMDDSDNEEAVPKTSNNEDDKTVNGNDNGDKLELKKELNENGNRAILKSSNSVESELKSILKPKSHSFPPDTFQNNNINNNSSELASDVDENISQGCHFVGGTPTWFDHYGDDKRQSNTLWFSNHEMDEVFEKSVLDNSPSVESTSPSEKYRTIIEVGNTDQSYSSKSSYQSTVSGTAIKLRVNSESQNTRL